MANQLEKVVKRTQAIYKQAAEELAEKLADFQARFAVKDKEKRALVAAGELTEQEYKNWLTGQVFQGDLWKAKAAEAARTMVHANEEAAAIVNNGCMTAYAASMNYGTYELERATKLNTGFTLYNRETVSRLMARDPQLLPKWKIDQKKDYVWNQERVNNAITQGVIQGKPIPEITRDLTSKLQTTNENKMRMFARTGMTGAHNAGRMDALHRAEDKGIRVLKKWVATNDDRTRDEHADMDGQIREIDEPFENRIGEIMYPGDPTADAANVYNCRCTMVYIYPELEDAPEDTEEEPEYDQMTFDQWVEEKENQEAVQGEPDPETVTMEDAREPEPEIMAEAEELDQQAPEEPETATEKEQDQIIEDQDTLGGLSDETIEAIDERQAEHYAEPTTADPSTLSTQETVDRFHEEMSEIRSNREEMETEYSELFTQSLTSYGTDEYEEIETRMGEVQDEITQLYAREESARSELESFLSGSGESEIRETFGTIDGPHSMREDLGSINTINENKITRNNCGYCTLAYDARRRGIDCSAPEIFGSSDAQIEKWWQGFQFTHVTSYYPTDAIGEIASAAEQWGPGARGIVCVDYSATFGHAFAFEIDGQGKCRFVDGQTGAMDVLVNFDNARPGSIRFGRTDDKDLTRNAMLFLQKGPAQ